MNITIHMTLTLPDTSAAPVAGELATMLRDTADHLDREQPAVILDPQADGTFSARLVWESPIRERN